MRFTGDGSNKPRNSHERADYRADRYSDASNTGRDYHTDTQTNIDAHSNARSNAGATTDDTATRADAANPRFAAIIDEFRRASRLHE